MKSIDRRIIGAYHTTIIETGQTPTDVFLGNKEMGELKEFALNLRLCSGIKTPPEVGEIMGMRIHETSDESIIATGWTHMKPEGVPK